VLEADYPTLNPPGPAAANASALLEAVDAALPPALFALWRWRVLLLRARIDARLAATGGVDCADDAQRRAYEELARIYFVNNSTQSFLRPPCT
jgi:hypothetical protein